jgi:hypothetical protein
MKVLIYHEQGEETPFSAVFSNFFRVAEPLIQKLWGNDGLLG